ncbi:NAD(P)-dependent oxidoreductase [Streptacidiphilus sp. P02-A3a]|uniref:NAD(P)-dependent oxidoreductase n=1 Tax=Streptacidiphilus sp. P02-A3a TaxID=2704468 RepID=UPI0015FAA2AC|nr:NAD(P)-binding oxidoreductase [Streptacidiphilus sp. P02-A3a]QMU69645.1 SDR family oxidoreductase [Streptacidiphilus sp. P02-A3a]
MNLAILAASGATGLALTRQALERGHTVTAIARTPARISLPDHPRLTRVAADVHDPRSVEAALRGSEVVLSGLGVAKGDGPGTLTLGARALADAGPGRIVWLGAYGTGPSAQAAGWATRTLLKAMGAELADKVTADATVLAAGGTVFHAGPLSNGPLSPDRRTVGLDGAPRRFFPARVSRSTVAAAMLDEAQEPHRRGQVAIPLEH